MLKQCISKLQPKSKRVMGFRLNRELDDCGKEIMAVFGVADFYRDYENVWEWVESGKKEQIQVNISRPHDWKTGIYDVPVIVRVSGPATLLTDKLFFERAQQLADRLHTEIWIGRPTFPHEDDSRYEFDIETRFSPKA